MTEEHDLIRAIVLNPDEDVPRLMYADFLQEKGQSERAHYIRSEIDITRSGGKSTMLVGSDSPTRSHCCPWVVADLDVFPFGMDWDVEYTRGFISHVTCSLADWMVHGSAICEARPVTRVLLTDKDCAADMDPDGNGADLWCFHETEWRDPWREHVLPNELAPYIMGKHTPAGPAFYAAVNVLSGYGNAVVGHACVQWARRGER